MWSILDSWQILGRLSEYQNSDLHLWTQSSGLTPLIWLDQNWKGTNAWWGGVRGVERGGPSIECLRLRLPPIYSWLQSHQQLAFSNGILGRSLENQSQCLIPDSRPGHLGPVVYYWSVYLSLDLRSARKISRAKDSRNDLLVWVLLWLVVWWAVSLRNREDAPRIW